MTRLLGFLALAIFWTASAFGYTPAAMPTNTALQGAATITYPGGLMRDTFGNNNGAPPLYYVPSGVACPLNAGAGDNGSQVKSADGKCWIAQPANGEMDVRQWGAKADGSTDNSATLQAALNWAGTGVGILLIPPGALDFATAQTVAVAAGEGLKIKGMGKRTAQLLYTGTSPAFASGSPPAGCALTINLSTQDSTIDIDSLWLNTSNAGTANGLCLNQSATKGGPEIPPSLTHLSLGGSSALTNYFRYSLVITGLAGLNVSDLAQYGDAAGTQAIGILQQGNGTNYSFALQMVNSTVSNNLYGYIYGPYVQGVAISTTGFYNSTTAIYSAPGEVGTLAGLFLTNIQIGTTGRCIDLRTSVIQTTNTGGICLGGPSNDYGIYLPSADGSAIVGMTIAPNAGTNVTGIYLNGPGAVPTTVEGNVFQGAHGIAVGPTATNVHIGCNNGFNLSGGGNAAVSGVGAANSAYGSVANTVCGTTYTGGSGTTLITAGETMYTGLGASASELAIALIPPRTGKLRNLYAVSSAAPGAGQSYVVTIRISGSNTPITCTISGTGNICQDILDEFYLSSPLDILTAGIVSSAGAASANFTWGLQQDAQ